MARGGRRQGNLEQHIKHEGLRIRNKTNMIVNELITQQHSSFY